MTRSEIRAAFDDGPALVSYVAAGDPSADATKEYVEALVDGGTDVVELGLPFSEPVAEGTTIQNAIKRALEAGMTPEAYLDLVRDLDVDVPIVCMTYYNLIYQYGDEAGPEEFVAAAADAGISGFVVPDLPVNESEPMYEACREHGLDLIFIVAPTTTPERLESMLDRTTGFVYVQGRLGTTGARDEVSENTPEALERLQDANVPKAVGFGISSGEQAREVVASGADGVIVGSAYVDIIADGVENDLPTEEVADRLEALAAELKAGARKGLPEPERK
ncbi:tryptophan synthase subunit alpha [Halobacterium sp. KA-4]|uniref:tryptophan synthase subunit alpha n=1 Tax=Halobacterium sp. KA-4 TaxID=2896367 RepID=UPI001E55BCDE|nr:tryptophan synthase subunit alpha [Halobacterium sp. KA-4]MCD2198516.1 tryptophan synthase subunit alpha [Halobacterium sp. KA-4]